MHPTPEPCALDMWSGAMEAPVPNLVAEPTELPCGTLFVAVVSIVHSALAAIIPGEPHLRAGPSLFGTGACGYFVQCVLRSSPKRSLSGLHVNLQRARATRAG